MRDEDGRVPPTPRSARRDVPRVAQISALLAEIDALRTTLSTDMSLAAAAVEAGAEDIAGEIVAGDLSALHGFERSALGHLHALDVPPVTTSELDEPAALPVAARRRPRRTRRMLPAAPVLAAAAALIGFVTGVVPDRSAAPSMPVMSSAAAASWELNRLADSGASADELRRAAEDLNAELAELVAAAGTDPAAAQQALLLLRDTTEVLQTAGEPAELAGVLREARALVARLTAVLPRVPRTLRPAVPAVPVLPVEQPRPRRTTSDEDAGTRSGAPSSSPGPTASPATASTPAPAPQPTTTTSPEPSATPTPGDQPLLPPPGDLPSV